MWQPLQEEIRRQHDLLDRQCRAWLDGYAGGGRVWCARGCRSCCRLAVHCSFTEALLVAGAMSDRHAAPLREHVAATLARRGEISDLRSWLRLHRRELGGCPFLEADGACGVYAARPFSCRALLSTRNAEWCAADLGELSPLEKELYLASLDPAVVAFPTHYVAATRDLGRRLESEALDRMAARLGFSLAGNLPLLAFLEREHRLSEAAGQGYEAAAALLARLGLNHPVLVALGRRDD